MNQLSSRKANNSLSTTNAYVNGCIRLLKSSRNFETLPGVSCNSRSHNSTASMRVAVQSRVVNGPQFEARTRPEPAIYFLKPDLGPKAKFPSE